MSWRATCSFISLVCLLLVARPAAAFICHPAKEPCWDKMFRSSSTSPASPTTSSTVRINPSAVPVEKGFGFELLAYKGDFDFALVQGLGRVGAAISPSNSEETFFGPPGFEHPGDFLERKIDQVKFPSQKLTLATAFNVLSNKKKGLRRLDLNLGLMGKYNKALGSVTPGGGLSAIAGPFSLGYSTYSDQTLLEEDLTYFYDRTQILYRVETYSIGLFLHSLALDHSVMRILGPRYIDSVGTETESSDVATISVSTASLIMKQGMFTLALRKEDSDRPYYNPSTQLLETRREKNEIFGGAQISGGGIVMAGIFYNYYLLREISFGLTFFF